jgi:hypothetical protein
MTQELQNKANILNSAELKELLGPSPVLSSENAKAYDEMLTRLMECFGPRDFMEQLLIWLRMGRISVIAQVQIAG